MFRPDLLKNKKVLITGGGTGLGKAVGRRYGELGAELVICGRRQDVLEATARELTEQTGARVTTHPLDLRDATAVEAMLDAIWQERPLDMLINNAAAYMVARTERLSPRAIDAVLNTSLHGSFYCAVGVGRRWIDADQAGAIVNVVATPAFTGAPLTVAAASAKAGILAMTRSLAVEWGPKKIRVNAVAPGVFPTPGAAQPGTDAELEARWVPLGRAGEHVEFANLMAFLAADEMSYINGELIVIDGGRWLQGTGGPALREAQGWTNEQWDQARKR